MPKRKREILEANHVLDSLIVEKNKKPNISFDDLEDFSSNDEDEVEDNCSSSSSEVEVPSDDDEYTVAYDNSTPVLGHNWKPVKPPETVKDIKSKFYVSEFGPCNIENCKTPMDFFSLFMSDSVFTMMTHHTNAYAKHKIKKPMAKNSRNKFWKDVTNEEMKQLVAILLSMGITRRASMAQYWNTKSSQFIPFYSKVMRLKRFQTVLSMLRLSSSLSDSSHDLYKNAHDLLTVLNVSFKEYFVPGQDISVREGAIGTKKHHNYVQYLPNNSNNKHHIKKIDLCDSSSGYVFHSALIKYKDRRAASMFSERVVMEVLTEAQIIGKGHHIFTDHPYTSFGLARELLSLNTYLTGISKMKSNNLKLNSLTPLENGATLYFRNGDFLLIKRLKVGYKRSLHMVSTGCHAGDKVSTNKKGKQKVKPLPIYVYNKQRLNVERNHQSTLSTCKLMTRSFWKRIVYNLIDVALINAFVLYKARTSSNGQHHNSRHLFILEIIESLAFNNIVPTGSVVKNTHRLLSLPNLKTCVCEVCKRPKSRHFCPGCNVGVHEECFSKLKHYLRINR